MGPRRVVGAHVFWCSRRGVLRHGLTRWGRLAVRRETGYSGFRRLECSSRFRETKQPQEEDVSVSRLQIAGQVAPEEVEDRTTGGGEGNKVFLFNPKFPPNR